MTPPPGGPECVWRWASPMLMSSVGAGGIGRVPPPLAIIELRGDVDAALKALNARPAQTGSVKLVRLPGVDELVIARPEPGRAFLFPHAGPMALEQIAALLERAGIRASGDPRPTVPGTPGEQPRVPIEGKPDPARAIDDGLLLALSRLQSPMGVDILLEHARRGREESDRRSEVSLETACMLQRVLVAPTVAAIGPPNIGKSSLLNALAKRRVSIVADEPGTTRDHVGVRLNLAGLHVQYLDCPGWGAAGAGQDDAILCAAAHASMRVAAAADLVLSCGDPLSGFLPDTDLASVRPPCGVLRVMLRDDLASSAPVRADASRPCVRTSVHQDQGLEALAGAIVERLIPEAARLDPGIWRFWDA